MIRPSPILLLTFALTACASDPPLFERRVDEWDHQEAELVEAQETAPAELTELEALLHYARTHNPQLEAAFQRWRQALERVPQATVLPEPQLGLGAYLSEVETRVGPMQGRIGLTQAFPWFGELDAAGEIAFQASEAARAELEVVRLEIDAKVRDTWSEVAWLERAIAITIGHQELLLHWESVARAKLETGIGTHADVIRTQVELGKLEDRRLTLEDLRRPLRARLNAALGRRSGDPLPTPAFPLPDPAPLDETVLAEGLPGTSPVLNALEFRVQAASQEIVLAGKASYPDFQIGADYTLIGAAENPGVSGSGDDAFAVTLGLSLPFWSASYEAGEREAEAGLHAARREHRDTWNRLEAELEMSLYRFRDADRRVALFEESLIPKGEESVQALDTAYQAGTGGFLDLIDAQRLLLEFQLEAARARSDRAQALAETERISGVPLHGEL